MISNEERTKMKGKVAVVLGARGGTGKMIIRRLCERGENEISEIRAVVRNNKSTTLDEEKASFPNDDRVRVIFGDVTDLESLRPALTSCNFIFNTTSGNHSYSAKTCEQVDRDSVGNSANLATQEFSDSVERYVLVTSQLVHPSNKWNPVRIFLNNIVTGPFARSGLMDYKWEGEELLRKSGIPYTIVRPGQLIDAHYSRKILVGQTNAHLGKPISRYDVAGVCVAAAMSEKAKNTTFELGAEPLEQETPEEGPSAGVNLPFPMDLFDNLQPHLGGN
jgi:uncharacterized protein YbjT (DUF2867 family)